MEERAVAERHCSSSCEETGFDPLCPRMERRHPACNPSSFSLGLEPVRTRGDLTGSRGRSVDAGDRSFDPARSVYGEPRDRTPLRSRGLSSGRSRSAGLGQRTPPETLSAGDSPTIAEGCGQEAELELVTGADLRVAEEGDTRATPRCRSPTKPSTEASSFRLEACSRRNS